MEMEEYDEGFIIDENNYNSYYNYKEFNKTEKLYIRYVPKNGKLIIKNFKKIRVIIVEVEKNAIIKFYNLINLEIVDIHTSRNYKINLILGKDLNNFSILYTSYIDMVNIIDNFNYLDKLKLYFTTVDYLDFNIDEKYLYVTSLNIMNIENDKLNTIDIKNLNKLVSIRFEHVTNFSIYLDNLTNLKSISCQNFNNSVVILGKNLPKLNEIFLHSRGYIPEILDTNNYLDKISRFYLDIRSKNIILDDKFTKFTNISIYADIITTNIETFSRLVSLDFYEFKEININSNFLKLSNFQAINETETECKINLNGSKFPNIFSFTIICYNLTLFETDYVFGRSSLNSEINLHLDINKLKKITMFFKNNLKLNIDSYINFSSNTKFSSNFRRILPEDLIELYSDKIDLPISKNPY